ncbi:DNA-directed RNA polymerase subunit omega [bacterium]|nr:DNA-directed RNA polymerase subunit omega [Candidatus Neomarinimicrobiota bacterium]MCK5684464.1 DNA-directed RNA polymerase subunit omega [bacterium]
MSEDFKYQGNRPDDIFEAISVMAKRARQINQKRADKFTLQPYVVDGEEEFETEIEIDTEYYDSLEKPTTIAMKEFAKGGLEFEYVEESEEEEGDGEGDDEENIL